MSNIRDLECDSSTRINFFANRVINTSVWNSLLASVNFASLSTIKNSVRCVIVLKCNSSWKCSRECFSFSLSCQLLVLVLTALLTFCNMKYGFVPEIHVWIKINSMTDVRNHEQQCNHIYKGNRESTFPWQWLNSPSIVTKMEPMDGV